jgi:alpha-tubulin suppressor-like RCC1 family protein
MRASCTTASRLALAIALLALPCACSQSIDVLGPAPPPASPGVLDGGLPPDPDDGAFPPTDAAGPALDAASPSGECDACGVAQLCAVDRCVDAAGVTSLASVHAHACHVADGQLFCWGEGAGGRLGVGDVRNRSAPARVGSFNDWLQVATGESHSCAVSSPGLVYCWGSSDSAQLGVGDTDERRQPAALPFAKLVREVACGGTSCCAIDSDAELWCWGDNLEGKPGQDDLYGSPDVMSPLRVRVAQGTRWRTLAIGQGHVCAIQDDGSLWCWGRNTNGQLGIGLEPGQTRVPGRVGSDSDWIAIAAGQHHSCGVRDDGSLWCWGENAFFELAAPDAAMTYPQPREIGAAIEWASVAAGWFHTCAIARDARLFCWGRAIEGQLGQEMPIEGQLVDLEGVPLAEPGLVVVPVGWRRVVNGNFHSCGIDVGGATLCWGDNSAGQLGVGDDMRRPVPSPVQ